MLRESEYVLIAVCDAYMRDRCVQSLQDSGYQVTVAPDREKALSFIAENDVGVAVVCSQQHEDSDMDLLSEMVNLAPKTEIIALLNEPAQKPLPQSLRTLVFSVIDSTASMESLGAIVANALERRRLLKLNSQLASDLQAERDRLWHAIASIDHVADGQQMSGSLMQAMIDGIPEVTILVDMNHRIVLANRAARQLHDVDPVLHELTCHQLLHHRNQPCSNAKEPCSLCRVRASKKPETLVHRHYDKNGRQSLVEVRAIPIFDSSGEVVQFLESCRDVTEQVELREKVSAFEQAIERHLSHSELLVGKSHAIGRVRHMIAQVAPTQMTALVRGESGTGKNVVAQLIHEWSGRSEDAPFVIVNCPAIPELLLESEMFGHERGAFTGAERRKPGRFELAANGTIFLDEVGLMPPALQAKLLHAIEYKTFMRVGGQEPISIDARIVAATNAPLEEMVADGRFRADLYYRINQFQINLPALRDRREDIPLLANHFFLKATGGEKRQVYPLPEEILNRLAAFDWPGNVRELKTVVERYALTGHFQFLDEMSSKISDHAPVASIGGDGHLTGARSGSLQEMRDDVEAKAILDALEQSHWNQRAAAERLGIGYGALRYRIAKYGIRD